MRSLFVICIVALTGCAQNGYSKFYQPYFNPQTPPPGIAGNLKYLAPDEAPQVFSSHDLSRDVKIAQSKYWQPIGYSSFNGAMGTQDQVVSEAKSLGAAMVLVTSKFTENRIITTPLFIPNNQTTYYNGMTNGQVYANNGNSANYNSNTTGSATTYGTTVVPLTSVQARYEQEAIYFVRLTRKFKFGVATSPLTPELRSQYERNTGTLVEIVYENTPAFNANILPGDIITELDGKVVEGPREFNSMFAEVHPANGLLPVKILRNGREKVIMVQLDN